MKIYLRYPPPKSSSSGEGLAIATLKVFYLITLFDNSKLITALRGVHNMKIYLRYPPPKSLAAKLITALRGRSII